MEKHGVIFGAVDPYPDASPEEGQIVEAVLEDLKDIFILKNSTYKAPSCMLMSDIRPIASRLSPSVIEWNHESGVAGPKPNARNVSSRCFNVDRNSFASLNVLLLECG